MIEHPNYVFIPQSTAEGVRSYREPDVPHPLQLDFLEEAGERAYVEHLRALLSAGRLDEADALLGSDLAGFDGRLARLCQAATRDLVTIAGWDDLLPILAEFEGPPITAITVGLTNDPDLVFDNGAEHEPALAVAFYSDDSYRFSSLSAAALSAECLSEAPAFAGHDEDVEFYALVKGLAPLNTALIHSKHRYFLRDGRDGIDGRAPGGYVEYVLAAWHRALRFLQALDSASAAGGLPCGARLVAGTSGMHTDFACVLGQGAGNRGPDELSSAPAPVAALTMRKWSPRPDPLADSIGSGSAIRRKVASAGHSPVTESHEVAAQESRGPCERALDPVAASCPSADRAGPAQTNGPGRGFFSRLFRRRG